MLRGIKADNRGTYIFNVRKFVRSESETAEFLRNQQMPDQNHKQVARAMTLSGRIESGIALQKDRSGDGLGCGAAIPQRTQQWLSGLLLTQPASFPGGARGSTGLVVNHMAHRLEN